MFTLPDVNCKFCEAAGVPKPELSKLGPSFSIKQICGIPAPVGVDITGNCTDVLLGSTKISDGKLICTLEGSIKIGEVKFPKVVPEPSLGGDAPTPALLATVES